MATGIPTKAKQNDVDNPELMYSGKMCVQDVICQPYKHSYEIASLGATSKNILYYGDNLNVLLELYHDSNICGHIRLAYIDPPFSTGSEFQCRDLSSAYQDTDRGSQYVEFLRRRMILIRELLADDGSFYLHLDSNMVFHMKVILDEVFGRDNFRGMITRKKCSNKNYTKNTYGDIADYILFYTKSSNYVWHRQYEPWTDESALKEYPYIDDVTGRRHKRVPLHAPGVRNGETGMPWRGKLPPRGKHWQYTPETMEEMDRKGEIYWSKNGNPRRKVFLDQSNGIPVQNIWLNYRDSINQNDHSTGYPTEKNLEMLKRIVSASSNPGDYVLDCFCGSGTTLEAAASLDRSWIGVDVGTNAIKASISRLTCGTERYGDYVTQKKTGAQNILPIQSYGFSLKSNQECDELMNSLQEMPIIKRFPSEHAIVKESVEYRDTSMNV